MRLTTVTGRYCSPPGREEIERSWAELFGADRVAELKATLADLSAGLERGRAAGLDPTVASPSGGGRTG